MFPPLTLNVGLGLKPQHYDEALALQAPGVFYEVHAENYFVDGGPRLAWLTRIAEHHPLSIHGVGLSLAGDEVLDPRHLQALARLVDRFAPALVSEHLAWSRHGRVYYPDLLPVPRNLFQLQKLVERIDQVQTLLKRPIAIENPSHYLTSLKHDWDEAEFMIALVRRSGCQLILDLNNIEVSAHNLGQPVALIDSLPGEAIAEIHLAGYSPDPEEGEALWIDAHNRNIATQVWQHYERLLQRVGPKPTLIEWDGDVPDFSTLLAERQRGLAIWEHAAALAKPESPPVVAGNTHASPPTMRGADAPSTEHRDNRVAPWAQALRQLPESMTGAVGSLVQAWSEGNSRVYRNTVWLGWLEALAAQFPATASLLGENIFTALARAYIEETPPENPALIHYGSSFADFLRKELADAALDDSNFADANPIPGLSAAQRMLAAPDLAACDWLWSRAHTAANAPILDNQGWQTALAQPQLPLQRHPATYWLKLPPLHTHLWRTLHPLGDATAVAATGEGEETGKEITVALLFTRPHLKVLSQGLSATSCNFLMAALSHSLDTAIEAISQEEAPDFASIVSPLLSTGAFSA